MKVSAQNPRNLQKNFFIDTGFSWYAAGLLCLAMMQYQDVVVLRVHAPLIEINDQPKQGGLDMFKH